MHFKSNKMNANNHLFYRDQGIIEQYEQKEWKLIALHTTEDLSICV